MYSSCSPMTPSYVTRLFQGFVGFWLLKKMPGKCCRNSIHCTTLLWQTCVVIRRIADINKVRYTEHFYQPSSLQQVMDLLKTENVEPVLRRSALNQVSVMVEDPLLHQTFWILPE
ncbi:hypothetical protein NQ317_012336 [Molorchus minor]|uniref:Uncharacterized protein n=1 Tax=Molorchus minor TaxID=1323400 RepID=A0ABQ9IRJ3_9CUCU|nr:hypothetical protein NQ317_012336 [Molorchus minor]